MRERVGNLPVTHALDETRNTSGSRALSERGRNVTVVQNGVFAVGVRVKWSSQSRGRMKEKDGVIVEIVVAGNRPSLKWADIWAPGSPRNHESYVVEVGKRHYWPLVKNIQIVKQKAA